VPVVDTALKQAGVGIHELDAIAFTRGPGLLGSLLVGSAFAKGLALSLNIPLIGINHLMAHVLALFIPDDTKKVPAFPFLCMLVSGGHTQLMRVDDYLLMETLGKTIDDAAGEAFDKCAKIMELPYPGGPVIDKLAVRGDPKRFSFARPQVDRLDFSFSGLKTSFLYFLRDHMAEDPDFIKKYQTDLAASLQYTIVEILMEKLVRAAKQTGIKEIAIAGGVSANSGLIQAVMNAGKERGWNVYIPDIRFTTDNAAMVAITGYYKYLSGLFDSHDITPLTRMIL